MPTDINSLSFDENNPAKTLSTLAHIDELKAQQFLSDLPLTDYIAICIAMQNKDLEKLRSIVGKHKLKEDQYHEAIDLKVANELRKISQNSPHQDTVDNATTNAANTPGSSTVPTAPSGMDSTVPSAASTSTNNSGAASSSTTTTSGTTGTVGSSGTMGSNLSNGSITPGTPPAEVLHNIVSADSKTGTVAMKNPLTKKVEIKSMKDPKQEPEIMSLIKNAGL